MNKQLITTLQPGEIIYVDIRTWGEVGIRLLGYPICSILDMWTSGRSLDGRRSLLAYSDGVRFMVSSKFLTMLVCLIGDAGENYKRNDCSDCGDVRPLSVASPVVESSRMRIVYDRCKCEVYVSQAYP